MVVNISAEVLNLGYTLELPGDCGDAGAAPQTNGIQSLWVELRYFYSEKVAWRGLVHSEGSELWSERSVTFRVGCCLSEAGSFILYGRLAESEAPFDFHQWENWLEPPAREPEPEARREKQPGPGREE